MDSVPAYSKHLVIFDMVGLPSGRPFRLGRMCGAAPSPQSPIPVPTATVFAGAKWWAGL